MSEKLSHTFLAHAGPAGARLEKLDRLEQRLADMLTRSQKRWPAIEVDPEFFVARIGEKVAKARDPATALLEMHTEDLYLASGCLLGRPEALRALDACFLSEAAAHVRRTMSSATLADTVGEILRERLLVGEGGAPPKIRDYSGRGALGAWLRVAALRTARNQIRADRPFVALDAAGDVRAREPDPELEFLKKNCAAEFRAAFQSTLLALSPDERAILRLYHLDGMTVEAIGALYRVHASTVTRRIRRARERILVETKGRLSERLSVVGSELDGVMDLIQSRLELSIRRCLDAEPRDPFA
jgi:RNA polymerase sigma-70 factor, ECF subfamily